MGLRDRVTDAIGGVLGGGLDILTESFEKANNRGGPPENGAVSDEPARRSADETDGTMAMTEGSQRATLPPAPPTDDPKGLLYDPFALIDQLGYRDRPSGLTYNTLRAMAKRVPTYMAILQTRMHQVGSFAQRQENDREPGFGVVLRDDKATPTKQDNIRMREMENMILQTGVQWHPGRDSFRTFIKKVVRDSLVLDQLVFEIQRNRKGLPCAFYAQDGATYRLADVPPGAESMLDPEQVRYVQVYDEVIIAEFAAHELCFGIRNPRTDIRANGYGFSELEMLINVITASLWGFDYNKRQFSHGSLVNGVMNFKGSVPEKKVDAFRRQWKHYLSGVNNAHRVPMTNVDELQWIDFGKTNRDMEYGAWMDWLIKITCAVCQFDPAEMNFNYGNTGQSNQMFATPVESKIKSSKDRGLQPILRDVADWLNMHIVWPLDPYFKLQFMGLDAKSSDQVIEQGKKRATYLMTVDELRAEEDLDPLPDGQGAVILDPTWLQNKQANEAAAQGGFGEEGDPMGDGEGPGGGGNLFGMGGGDSGGPDGDGSADLGDDDGDDFDALFPDPAATSKAMPRQARGSSTLRKSGNTRATAKVRVFEIEL